jgi:zinc protease
MAVAQSSLLPLWEKVDWRAAPRRLRGVGRSAVFAKLEHLSSNLAEPVLGLAGGKTRGRGHPLPQEGEKERRGFYASTYSAKLTPLGTSSPSARKPSI